MQKPGERALENWLEAYMEFTDYSEPPGSYHLWTGLTVISAALQRKSHIFWNNGELFPNIFVVLVGKSGRCRKGTALSFGREMISNVKGVHLASQAITRQAFVKDLSGAQNNFINPVSGVAEMHCSLAIFSTELQVFLGAKDIEFLGHLTDLYDSLREWEYKTKNSGTDSIRGACVTMLGATAPDWLIHILPYVAVGGGFTSRIIFVVEEDKRKTTNPLNVVEGSAELHKLLVHDLEQIHQIAGRFTWEDGAAEAFWKWYKTTNHMVIESAQFAGYCSRRPTHVAKLCMLYSAARTNSRQISQLDLNNAIRTIEATEIKMPKAFKGLGTAPFAPVIEAAADYFESKGKDRKVSKSELLRYLHPDCDIQIADVVINTLLIMKVIRIAETDSKQGMIYYAYTGKSLKSIVGETDATLPFTAC